MHHFTLLVRYPPPLMSAIDNGDDGKYYYSITHMSIFHICKPDIEIFGSDFWGLQYHSSLFSATVADPRAFRFCLKFFKEKCIEVNFKGVYVTTDPHIDVCSTSISSRYTSISIDISSRDPNGIPNPKEKENPKNSNAKPKVVVIMGATGSGKSRLAIDLTSLFPIEIINADSMQVYEGLDVLTNKVPLDDQKVSVDFSHENKLIMHPYHFKSQCLHSFFLNDIRFCVEHTSSTRQKTGNFCTVMAGNYTLVWDNSYSTFFKKALRYKVDCIPPVVEPLPSIESEDGDGIICCALVSRFLLDDSPVDTEEINLDETYGDKQQPNELMQEQENFSYSYDNLKDLDPVAANRIHPNDHRKINQYLHLYASSGVLPSKYL
ncbi:unnamed protein product [Lactuca saligna]|uniref:Uncharacterized protein n=1 Tax=Lactuca saligna TaxID=75948 RepID=A0AA35Z094_LACSI|nr:unnamed protein product [Lactuca saligna]